MFRNKSAHELKIDLEIDSVLTDLTTFTSESDDYAAAIDKLERLYAIRAAYERPSRVEADTLVKAAAHIAGIVVIVGYEQRAVVTTKATMFLSKMF